MASVLPAMAAQGAWTAAERAALAALRQQHREAVQKVGATSAGLAVHLQQMNTQKEGWLAYALDNDFAGIQA
ncbi:hypothetical protein [Pseudoduganella umbonata]|nr:hypothetical protein [Pseudoduganella umbonata]MBB3221433.1 hypothetical protein [Pseudoduganella umbonata]